MPLPGLELQLLGREARSHYICIVFSLIVGGSLVTSRLCTDCTVEAARGDKLPTFRFEVRCQSVHYVLTDGWDQSVELKKLVVLNYT